MPSRRRLAQSVDGARIPRKGVFAHAEERFLQQLSLTGEHKVASPGDVLLAAGQQVDAIFILVRGIVEVVKDGEDAFAGDVFGMLQGPNFFGEACRHGLRQTRDATLKAKTVCHLRIIPGRTMRSLLNMFPREQQRFEADGIANILQKPLESVADWEDFANKFTSTCQDRDLDGSTISPASSRKTSLSFTNSDVESVESSTSSVAWQLCNQGSRSNRPFTAPARQMKLFNTDDMYIHNQTCCMRASSARNCRTPDSLETEQRAERSVQGTAAWALLHMRRHSPEEQSPSVRTPCAPQVPKTGPSRPGRHFRRAQD